MATDPSTTEESKLYLHNIFICVVGVIYSKEIVYLRLVVNNILDHPWEIDHFNIRFCIVTLKRSHLLIQDTTNPARSLIWTVGITFVPRPKMGTFANPPCHDALRTGAKQKQEVNSWPQNCLDSTKSIRRITKIYLEEEVKHVFSHAVLKTCSYHITGQLGLFLNARRKTVIWTITTSFVGSGFCFYHCCLLPLFPEIGRASCRERV